MPAARAAPRSRAIGTRSGDKGSDSDEKEDAIQPRKAEVSSRLVYCNHLMIIFGFNLIG
jgi:hypothetical protein